MQISIFEGARLISQRVSDDINTNDTLESLLVKLHGGELAGCEIDVLAKDGTWRDIGGENPLLMTLAAAGVAPDQTEAVRFRLPPTAAAPSCSVADGARRRGQAGGPAARRRRWVRRCVGLAAVMVKAVLVLEAVGWAAQLVGDSLQRRRRQDGGADDPGSGSGTDPADVLMAYLTGSKGSSSLAALNTEQMAEAVDALGSSDFQELGVEDGGAELRAAVEDLVLERQERRRQLEEAQAAAAAENEGRPTASRRTGRTPAVRRGMAGLPATKAGAWRRARGGEQAEGATGAKAGGGSGAGGAAATGGGAE